jgi:hypothetical protein
MPELGTYGSVRGAAGNSRPYRECRSMTVALRAPGPASANLQRRCYGAAARILHPSLLM